MSVSRETAWTAASYTLCAISFIILIFTMEIVIGLFTYRLLESNLESKIEAKLHEYAKYNQQLEKLMHLKKKISDISQFCIEISKYCPIMGPIGFLGVNGFVNPKVRSKTSKKRSVQHTPNALQPTN